jgi:hypothetical protein
MGRLNTCELNAKWRANLNTLGTRTGITDMSGIKIETLASMEAAAVLEASQYKFTGSRSGGYRDAHERVQRQVLDGNRPAVATALEASDALIDSVIAFDSRLARKPEWVRSDDGIFADAGLVACGDDSPCYDMTRAKLRDFASAGMPVVVCVSTDSSEPASGALAAFITTVRIVQQFRPVHVWWQGAWLADTGKEAGYVFLSPLVTNDMDFSRVQYAISDESRDFLSFGVCHAIATQRDRVRVAGMGRHAERAYIDGAEFVGKEGIKASAEAIASAACLWLGLMPKWEVDYDASKDLSAALQAIEVPYVDTSTPAEREENSRTWAKDSERRYEERKAKTAKDAANRLAKSGAEA